MEGEELATNFTTTSFMMEDSPAGLNDERAMANKLHYITSAIVGPIFCIIGFFGNFLSIAIWRRPKMTNATSCYFIGQAIADIGVLLMFLCCDSAQAWTPDIVFSLSYGVFFSYIGYPMLFFAVVLSVWITVGLTLYRYIMVCWIAYSKKYCNDRRAHIGLALTIVASFLVNIPHFASFTHVSEGVNGSTTGPQKTFQMTEFGGGEGGQLYEFWIHCIILILIPWSSVLFMNIQIIRQISRSNKNTADRKSKCSMEACQKNENQITRLLLTSTFAFLVFIGIQCIIQCFQMQQPSWANLDRVSSAFAFAKIGIVLNSSLNFVFYCLSGRRFRRELMKLLGFTKRGSYSSSFGSQTSSKKHSSTSSTGI